MLTYTQVQPFFISVFEAEHWEHPVHRHNHYELIYLPFGEGLHYVNEQQYPYQAGDIFLFNSTDYHYFDIRTRTRFCIFKINEGFLNQAMADPSNQSVFASLKPYFDNPGRRVSLRFDEPVYQAARAALELCLDEFAHKRFQFEQVIRNSLMTLLIWAVRECLRAALAEDGQQVFAAHLIPTITQHVHHYLQEPAQLTAKAIAAKVNVSEKYVGQLFKRSTQQTLKSYISKTRINAVKEQLLFSDKTVTQLAFEFGFTDESHLVKMFRHATGTTPHAFRRANLPVSVPAAASPTASGR